MDTSVMASLRNLGLTRYEKIFKENYMGDFEVEALILKAKQKVFVQCLDFLIPDRTHQREFVYEFMKIHMENKSESDSESEKPKNPGFFTYDEDTEEDVRSRRKLSFSQGEGRGQDESTEVLSSDDSTLMPSEQEVLSTTNINIINNTKLKSTRKSTLFKGFCKLSFLSIFIYIVVMFSLPLLPGMKEVTTRGTEVLTSSFQIAYRGSVRSIFSVDEPGVYGPVVNENVVQMLSRYEIVERYQEILLGPDHPDTLYTKQKIGKMLMSDQEQFINLAIRLFEFVYETRVRLLGPNHSETLSVKQDLSKALETETKLSFWNYYNVTEKLSDVIVKSKARERSASDGRDRSVDSDHQHRNQNTNPVFESFGKNQHSIFGVLDTVLRNHAKINEEVKLYQLYFKGIGQRVIDVLQVDSPDVTRMLTAEVALRKVVEHQNKLMETLIDYAITLPELEM